MAGRGEGGGVADVTAAGALRPAVSRTLGYHESTAVNIITRFALQLGGWKPRLPIPAADIVERCYELSVLTKDLGDDDEWVLATLDAATGTVCLNERYTDSFDALLGPEPFVLGHALGHWIYDTMDLRGQGQLFEWETVVRCSWFGASEQAELREVNASGFASSLLLPKALLAQEITQPFIDASDLADCAWCWGVSPSVLAVRLEKLGMGWALPGAEGDAESVLTAS